MLKGSVKKSKTPLSSCVTNYMYIWSCGSLDLNFFKPVNAYSTALRRWVFSNPVWKRFVSPHLVVKRAIRVSHADWKKMRGESLQKKYAYDYKPSIIIFLFPSHVSANGRNYYNGNRINNNSNGNINNNNNSGHG